MSEPKPKSHLYQPPHVQPGPYIRDPVACQQVEGSRHLIKAAAESAQPGRAAVAVQHRHHRDAPVAAMGLAQHAVAVPGRAQRLRRRIARLHARMGGQAERRPEQYGGDAAYLTLPREASPA